MKEDRKPLSRPALEIIAARFRALSDPSRLQILQSLFSGEKSVQELCELSDMNQANVSKHLSVLSEQGIVGKRRQGIFVYYRLADESIYQICDIVCGAIGKRFSQALKELS